MMRSTWLTTVGAAVLAVLPLVACDKGESGSGAGRAKGGGDELALFRDLPKGNTLLFGGNFIKLQKQLSDSPLGKLAAQVNKLTPGLDEWQTCFINGPTLQMAGGVTYAADGLDMRYATKGIDITGLEACAKKASFPATVDADRKFIAVDMNSSMGVLKSGYLLLPDGALFTHQVVPLGGLSSGKMKSPPPDRASLERDVASLSAGTAADDTALMTALAKLDRTKAVWVVGTGAGTPVADKLGLVTATVEMTDGVAVDVTADLADAALAEKLETGIAGAKKQAGQLGPEVAEIVNNVRFERTGAQVHVTAKISNAELTTLSAKLAPMMNK